MNNHYPKKKKLIKMKKIEIYIPDEIKEEEVLELVYKLVENYEIRKFNEREDIKQETLSIKNKLNEFRKKNNLSIIN